MRTRDQTRFKAPVSASVFVSLDRARASLREAARAESAADRYVAAHVAALRMAAAVLASRARPSSRRAQRSAWAMLARVAPELGEWATFFAANAPKRAAAEAGLPHAVTTREADDLCRDAAAFLAAVERLLELPHQPTLPQLDEPWEADATTTHRYPTARPHDPGAAA